MSQNRDSGSVLVLKRARESAPVDDSPEQEDATEASLVALARAGNVEAWSRLYHDHFDDIFRHVCYLTGSPQLSEDLVQDTFARAIVALKTFDGQSSLRTWLRGIGHNVVRMHWRRHTIGRRVHVEVQDLQQMRGNGSAEGPDVPHLRHEHMRAIYGALEQLPGHLREAFVLRELRGMTPEDAAEHLGISVGNFSVRASRARARIRRILIRKGWLDHIGGAG